MKKLKKVKYTPFSKYVLRTPLLSLDFFKNLISDNNISDDKFSEICSNPVIRESIFLASPSLSSQIDRYLNDEIKDLDKKDKLKFSVLKYISRMSSRCTPYGLFAGCTVGELSDTTSITLDFIQNHERRTRLDMNYVVALSIALINNDEIKNQLKFSPNSSIYKLKNKLRYIEYYYKNNIRHHDIVAVDTSEYLDKIVAASEKGLTFLEIANTIIDNEIDLNDAKDFVEELISSQILISDLEPSVSGPEFLNQIIQFLTAKFNSDNAVVSFLNNINEKLKRLDVTIGNPIHDYISISDLIKTNSIEFDLKYLFQCDLVVSTKVNSIDKKTIKNVEKVIFFLNKIRKIKPKTYLDNFKEAFSERYDGREMPISLVLDPEVGIGYGRNVESNDNNPLIDDLHITQPTKNLKDPTDIKWSIIDDIFQKKILNGLRNKQKTVTLTDDDFLIIPEASLENLPDTISFIIEIIKEFGQTKLKFNGGGGGSGASLLARFCHSDGKINDLVNEIIEFEHLANPNKLFAEIVHLPEARVGNILARPDFRNYEIPYLARSIKPSENQINIEDIMVSVKNNKIFLRSKKHNKEIIPRLTNAHNYSNVNSLPIYHFLSDMQINENSSGVYVDLSNFDALHKFIPRIEYENIILSYATWNLDKNDVKSLVDMRMNDSLKNEVITFKESFSLPDFFLLSEGDNELLVNLQNITSLKMFIETIKKKEFFKLTEFIFSEKNQIVKDGFDENYTNEVIISFFKNSVK